MEFVNGNDVQLLIERWHGRKYGAMSSFAKAIEVDRSTLHRKLSGEYSITKQDIELWSLILKEDLMTNHVKLK